MENGAECLGGVARRLGGALLLVAGLNLANAAAADGMTGAVRAPRVELGSSVAWSPDGVLHAVTKQGEHVMLYRSVDGGANWSVPVVVNAVPEAISADGENRPKLAFARDGGLLVSWTRPLGKPFSGEIRLARSDDGQRFAPPFTVHRDRQEITHRFDALRVLRDGRVVVAWIDKRDLEAANAAGQPYRGAAIYVAQSSDHGRSFAPEIRVADHSCECCRIALGEDADGSALVLWRHVFEPNERDHALARLDGEGRPLEVVRVTFERWAVDGCPHHGPSLALTDDGTRHAVWFNQRDGKGRVFYGRLVAGGVDGQRTVGGERAAHADIAAAGSRVAIVWKEFDGDATVLHAMVSEDGGASFTSRVLARSRGASDQPRVIAGSGGLLAFWRTAEEGMRGYAL